MTVCGINVATSPRPATASSTADTATHSGSMCSPLAATVIQKPTAASKQIQALVFMPSTVRLPCNRSPSADRWKSL